MANISNWTNDALVLGTSNADSILNYVLGKNYLGDRATLDAGDGNDTITNSGCLQVIIEGGGGDDIINNDGEDVYVNGGAGNDSINNGGTNASIVGGDGNDTIRHYSSNASIVGGAGDDLISLASYSQNNLIAYAAGDGNDSIVGFNETSTLSISGGGYSTQKSGSNIIVTVGNGKITLSGAANLSTLNIDGEEQSSDTLTLTNDDAAKHTIDADIIVADASSRTKATRIVGNAFDNSMLGGTGKDSLYGGNGDDYLSGGKGNDKLYEQSGDDTLWGGAGNDTLSGGLGEDLFIYSAGNDVITDYEAGEKISLGASITSASLSGSNVIFGVGSDTLTVKNGKDTELTLIDAAGKETTRRVGAATFDNTAAAKVTLAADVEFADAASRTKAIRITGNALDNSILGGTGKDSLYGGNSDDYLAGGKGNDKLYGQSGNDTLWGGAGNDTLTGGDGADKFIYADGEGNDVISGFDNNDMLLITGAFTASYDKANDTIAFQVGSGSITLKDFTATTFNVNGFNYRVKGSKLVK